MHHGTVSPEIAAGLLALKKRIEAANIAVWNIREFGRVGRTEAAIHYVAEIIGQFDFLVVALHARWGDSGLARAGEVQLLSDWLDTRFKHKFVEDHDLLVLGDFNTPKLTNKIFAGLTSRGLKIPTPLVQLKVGDRVIGGSNLGQDARYDQILHLPTVPANFTNHGSAVDFHIDDAHIEELFPGKHYTREKFTYQMSDHLPIWLQLKTDIDGFRLEQIVQAGKD